MTTGWHETAALKCYRLMLRLYPRSFRRAHGTGMEQLFRDCYRDNYRSSNVMGVVALWLRTLAELVPTTLREHYSEVTGMSSESVWENENGLTLRERRAGNVGVLEVDFYLNGEGSGFLAKVFDQLLERDDRSFLLNLEKMSIINSVGISRLIQIIERVKVNSGRIVLCGVSKTITKTFHLFGIANTVDLYETESEALSHMKRSD